MMDRQITRGTKIVLETVNSADLTKPLFAINWFSTRSLRLYNLYNMIATGSVFRIGAKVLFKGRVTETLLGPTESAREMLLVMYYPSGERFLDLLSSRFFQMTSLLRMLAVREFSFVLNTRADGPDQLKQRTQEFDPESVWAVHVYSSDRNIEEEVASLRAVTEEAGMSLYFASQPGVIVNTEDRRGNREPTNYVTDRVVILEADTAAQLSAACEGVYCRFVDSVRNSYIGRLDRTM